MPADDIKSQVNNWLQKEGYPLEYYAAHCFRSTGLYVSQGVYSRPDETSKPRELDLVVDANYGNEDRLLRIQTIVECKWSGDKPLVIFTSNQLSIHKSACICHTISSDICDAALWLLRDNENLMNLKTFMTPEIPGFGGRQAFGNTDKFYNAMLSVTAACATAAKEADKYSQKNQGVRDFGIVALPLIIVEGKIFETIYDESDQQMSLTEVKHSRCHWHGSADWPLRADVDVISRDYIEEFARIRKADCDVLGPLINKALEELDYAFENQDDSILYKAQGPTGRGSAPRLLYELAKLADKKRNDTPTS